MPLLAIWTANKRHLGSPFNLAVKYIRRAGKPVKNACSQPCYLSVIKDPGCRQAQAARRSRSKSSRILMISAGQRAVCPFSRLQARDQKLYRFRMGR
jgi:hypothetical protein